MKWLYAILIGTLLSYSPLECHADEKADELVIVSPHWEGIRREFTTAFKGYWLKASGRDVNIRWLDLGGGTSDIIKFTKSEFKNKPEGVGIDLFFGGGVDPYIELKKSGALAQVDLAPAVLSDLASSIGGNPLYDREHYWFSATMAGFGIIYNRLVLSRIGLQEPLTWEDAAAPTAWSWVGSADPRKSGSVHMIYELILQAYGWEKGWNIIYSIGGNARNFSAASSQTPHDVAVGEIAYGFVIDSYAAEAIKQAGSDKIGFVIPRNLSAIMGDGIAILKGAPNKLIANAFLNFVLSKNGQRLLMLKKGEIGGPKEYELGKLSVIPSLYENLSGAPAVLTNPFSWETTLSYDSSIASSRWNILNDLIGTFVIDAHPQLSLYQKTLIKNHSSLGNILPPPISLEELNKIIESKGWESQETRSRTISEWSIKAKARIPTSKGWAESLKWLPSLLLTLLFLKLGLQRLLPKK